MTPIEWTLLLSGSALVFILLFKSSSNRRSKNMQRMDMEAENRHLRHIVSQASLDRHLSGRRR